MTETQLRQVFKWRLPCISVAYIKWVWAEILATSIHSLRYGPVIIRDWIMTPYHKNSYIYWSHSRHLFSPISYPPLTRLISILTWVFYSVWLWRWREDVSSKDRALLVSRSLSDLMKITPLHSLWLWFIHVPTFPWLRYWLPCQLLRLHLLHVCGRLSCWHLTMSEELMKLLKFITRHYRVPPGPQAHV